METEARKRACRGEVCRGIIGVYVRRVATFKEGWRGGVGGLRREIIFGSGLTLSAMAKGDGGVLRLLLRDRGEG